jgi:phospholipase C
MENRSFDHFLGWMPELPAYSGNVAGTQNVVYPTRSGGSQSTWYLSTDTMGCVYKDPDHSWSGARIEYDSGKCDGWLLDTETTSTRSVITSRLTFRFSVRLL